MVFDNSVGTTVYGGSFSEIHGNQNNFVVHGGLAFHDSEAGISALRNASVLSATHDSFERDPPPKCHPETRKTVLRRIDGWVTDMAEACGHLAAGGENEVGSAEASVGEGADGEALFEGERSDEESDSDIESIPGPLDEVEADGKILWLHGPAGAGKSAVAQTVSEKYAAMEHLVGSFFFSRDAPGRDTAKHLFPTIAYQIAMRVPGMRARIGSSVKSDPSIFDKSHSAQVMHLIVRPFQSLLASVPTQPNRAPFLFVLDGLDECGKKDAQCDVLTHVADILFEHGLPLCFLVVSRPEAHIKDAFYSGTFRSYNIAKASLYAGEEAERDVSKYLHAEFDRIHRSAKHREFMKFVPKPWPTVDNINRLAQRSGGYFIYVSTAIRFVDEEYFHPVKRLEIVLDALSEDGSPFAELDKLYHQVLSTNPRTDLLIQILGSLSIGDLPSYCHDPTLAQYRFNNPQLLEKILGLDPGTVLSVLRGMHSLLKIQPLLFSVCSRLNIMLTPGPMVTPFHASFADFLFDEERAKRFYIDFEKHNGILSLALLKIIHRWDKESTSFGEHLLFQSWPVHARRASDPSDLLEELEKVSIKRWVAILNSATSYPYKSRTSVVFDILTWLKSLKDNELAHGMIRRMNHLLDLIFVGHMKDPGVDKVIVQGYLTLFPFDYCKHLLSGDHNISWDIGSAGRRDVYDFEDFMNDPARSKGCFDPPAVRHTHLALSCMHTLAYPGIFEVPDQERSLEHDFPMYTSGTPPIDSAAYHWHSFFTRHDKRVEGQLNLNFYNHRTNPERNTARLQYCKTHWASHLSGSSPGDKSILQCITTVSKHLINQMPTCETTAATGETLPLNDDNEPSTHANDIANAKLVIEWLQKMPEPPPDLIKEWTPCQACGKFHIPRAEFRSTSRGRDLTRGARRADTPAEGASTTKRLRGSDNGQGNRKRKRRQ